MESTKSNALARQSTDAELMPPPPKRIKRPKNVIDEDSYSQAISEIIARDFFPGLLESETKQDYLDALESKNEVWISSAQRRLEQIMTPGKRLGRRGTSIQTPTSLSNTPKGYLIQVSESTSRTFTSNLSDTQHIDTNMSLDNFQSKYTSEDNESFNKLIDAQNQNRAEKYAWMWSRNNKIPSKMMLKQRETEMRLLKSKNSLDDDTIKRDLLSIQDSKERPIKTWNSKPNNALMFALDSVEDSVQTVTSKAQDESRAEPRRVLYSNTRIPTASEAIKDSNASVLPSPSLSAVRNAISGSRKASESPSILDGCETPRVNGYAFVDDEPESNLPQNNKVIDIGIGDLTKNPFIIKEQSSREDLLHRIVDKNARKKRQSIHNGFTGKFEQTPIPKFPSSPRVASTQLTPAAQRLWSQVGMIREVTPHDFGSSKPKLGNKNRWSFE